MHITLEELEAKLLEENLKAMFQQAYEQGVKDAQERYSLPYNLKKEDIARIFQIEMPTVNKLVRKKGFPKLTVVQGRYPRDEVFEWMSQQTEYVGEKTNYFKVI